MPVVIKSTAPKKSIRDIVSNIKNNKPNVTRRPPDEDDETSEQTATRVFDFKKKPAGKPLADGRMRDGNLPKEKTGGIGGKRPVTEIARAPLSGFRRAKQIADEMGGGLYVPNFYLKSGDSAEIVFNGTREEPYIEYDHTIKGNKGPNDFTTVTCAADTPNHTGCVPCHYYENGNNRVGKPTPKAVFNIADLRWFHRIELREKNARGENKVEYRTCSDSPACKMCRAKIKREPGGQKKWTMSMMWMQSILGMNQTLGWKCAGCKRGKIKVLQYTNDMGREVDVEDPNNLPDGIEETLECSKCDAPARASIWDVPVTVVRTGEGKTTSYQFTPGSFDDEIPEWVVDLKINDLAKICRPYSSQAQAKRMGMKNPFGSGGGGGTAASSESEDDYSESYDADEEEEGSAEEDEDADIMGSSTKPRRR